MVAPLALGSGPAARMDAGEGVVRVANEDGTAYLEREVDGERLWRRALPAVPSFLQVAEGDGTSVVGAIGYGETPTGWARVVSAGGDAWDVPGLVRRAHLAADGERLLVRAVEDGHVATRVYRADGTLLKTLDLGASDDDLSVELSRTGDSVLVAPGGEAALTRLVLHSVDEDRRVEIDMPGGESADQAVAIDAEHLVTLGDGKLRYHRLGAGETGWARRPMGGYSTLLGVSRDGGLVLVSRAAPIGYELLDARGEVVWSWGGDGAPADRGDALSAIRDPRQVQVELLAEGDLLLTDRSSGRRFLVHHPGSGEAQVEPVAAGARVSPSGRVWQDG